jgi:hypothetical protein
MDEQRRPDSSPSRLAHRPGFRPRSENYAPTNSHDALASSGTSSAPFPRPSCRTPAHGYYIDATNSGLFPAAAVGGWSLSQQHHVVAAHQRALMLDHLVRANFRTNNAGIGIVGAGAAAWMQHQHYGVPHDEPRRSLHDTLMLEARREMQARLALARLADRTTSPSGGRLPGHGQQHQHSAADLQEYERYSLGRAPPRPLPLPLLPIFPTTPTTTMTSVTARPRSRRAGESSPSGLDLLHTAAGLNHLAGPVVVSPQPSRASPGPPLATTAATARTTGVAVLPSSDGIVVTEARSDVSAFHDAPVASPSRTMCPSAADEEPRFLPSSFAGRTYVETVLEFDILCGRGGKSNHHPGNKMYRHVVGYMKKRYHHCPGKAEKTDLSRQIVDYCTAYGARFLKHETETGQYYILSKDEARRKTSQALREPKMLKWTAM